jgi:hypothetical protein
MLLDHCWEYLRCRAPLAPGRGVRFNAMAGLVDAMTFALVRRRGLFVAWEQVLIDGNDLATTLERLVVAKRAVLARLTGGHYTIVCGFTPISWLLFDPTGRSWTKRVNADEELGQLGWKAGKRRALITLSRHM